MPNPETVARFTTAAFFVRYYHRPHQRNERAPHLAIMAQAAVELLSEPGEPETTLRFIADTLGR